MFGIFVKIDQATDTLRNIFAKQLNEIIVHHLFFFFVAIIEQ